MYETLFQNSNFLDNMFAFIKKFVLDLVNNSSTTIFHPKLLFYLYTTLFNQYITKLMKKYYIFPRIIFVLMSEKSSTMFYLC